MAEENKMKEGEPEAVELEKGGMPEYSDDEKAYLSGLQTLLFRAQQERDKKHPEFNGQTFIQNYENNERIANTVVQGKKFEGDIEIASGTVEQKMLAVLSEVNRLSLTAEVLAFDKNGTQFNELGQAFTDIMFETNTRENDKEKRILRQLELMKQGHVFVQESWVKRWKKEKVFDKANLGQFSTLEWKDKLTLAFEGPEKQILYAPGVYLGNIREPEMKKQPFIFAHKLTSYADIKNRFGEKVGEGEEAKYKWERFEFVSSARKQVMTSDTQIDNKQNNAWTLGEVQEGYVEEVHYMDAVNNEYQILLNGVMMLPVGFPLSAISPRGEYNIEKQIFQYINPFFAYGRSFVSRVKEQSDILDELLRLLMIKTRKSISTPYVNNSGRVISPKILMPGRITMGIDANALQPIGNESQGVTSSEYQMYELLQKNIDENTVSRQFTGQQGNAGTTAFEVNVLREQSQKLLSLVIASCVMLETKLGWLRLYNVLDNYFEPIDERYNAALDKLQPIFRTENRRTSLGTKGMGTRQIISTDTLPTSEDVFQEEQYTGVPPGLSKRNTRETLGMQPIERIYVSPEALKKIDIVWYIDVDTRPADTTSQEKLMFRQELGDMVALMNMGSKPDVSALEGQYALIWNRPKDKFFTKAPPPMAEGMPMGGPGAGGGKGPIAETKPLPMPTPGGPM